MNRDTHVPSLVAVAAIVALTAGCAGSDARPVATSETLVAADGEWIRCVDEPLTGSRIPHRKCLTEGQWRRLESPEELVEFYDPTDVFGDVADAIADAYPQVAPEFDDDGEDER